MRWVTRSAIHVDRAASAWLITRYIDTDAEFNYIDDPADAPDDAIPFDMVGCDLTHHDTDVTFETILRRYELTDPILWRIAQIIHQADVEDDLYDAPEAQGLDTIVRSLTLDHDDDTVRTITATILDSLYRYIHGQTLGA